MDSGNDLQLKYRHTKEGCGINLQNLNFVRGQSGRVNKMLAAELITMLLKK